MNLFDNLGQRHRVFDPAYCAGKTRYLIVRFPGY
jgi:hypothetical protein